MTIDNASTAKKLSGMERTDRRWPFRHWGRNSLLPASCTVHSAPSHFSQIQGQARSFPFQSWVEHPNSIEGELRLICDLDCEWDPHSGILLDSWSLSALIGASALQWEGWVEGTLGEGKTCKKQDDNSILSLLPPNIVFLQN